MPTNDGLLVRPFASSLWYLQRRDQPMANPRLACFTLDCIYDALYFLAQSSSQGDSLSHESIGIAHLCDKVERSSLISPTVRACSGNPPRDPAHPFFAYPSLRFLTEEMASLVKARGASHGHRLRVSQPTAFHIDPPRFTLNIAGSPRPPPRRRGKKFELVGQHMRTLKESVSQNI